jgi:hypothetical protein
MIHEKIFVRESGAKVKITVWLTVDYRDTTWRVDVETCQPKKRTWVNVYSTDDYSFRKLSPEDRRKFIEEKQMAVITTEELQEVKTELWMNLKP